MASSPKRVRIPRAVRREWASLAAHSGSPSTFVPRMADRLPEPARRWLQHVIEPGTLLWESAELTMRGRIRLRGSWLPFTAHQRISPSRGFIWAARASMRGLTISGYDRYGGGTGEMHWRLARLIPIPSADGSDVSRSSLGRLVGEGVMVPTAFRSASWQNGPTAGTALMSRTVDGQTEEAQLSITDDGRLTDVLMSRWGDPDGTGFGRFPFGMHVDEERPFDGITLPSAFRAGWWKGTDRESHGEFFRAKVTSVRFG